MNLKVVECNEESPDCRLQDCDVSDAQYQIEDDGEDGFIRALVITDVEEIQGREFADELVRRWNVVESQKGAQ